jgi:hypothetical protein
MKTITNHEPITQVALPEQVLPVLVPVNKSQMAYGRRAGTTEAADGYFFGDGAERVLVRLVDEDLRTLTALLTDPGKRLAFEAKYGLQIFDGTLKSAFFCLMLAEGQDPKRVLEFYRGSQPSGLFREGGPVAQVIQQHPLEVAVQTLNRGLDEARPVVWRSFAKKTASLGLFCPDAYTVLFALALRGMGLPGGLGACQRCGKPFPRSRRTQRYCSHRCQLAASMRRFRERHPTARKRDKRRKPLARKHFRRTKR